MNIQKAAKTAAKVFRARGWEWYDGVPDRDRLVRAMEDLLESVEDADQVEAGRLVAIKTKYDTGGTEYKLCLILGTDHYGY